MAIEHTQAHLHPKPWGIADLHPWSSARHDGDLIGEIWFERPDEVVVGPSLQLKLLFTSQPLSIQVHPDDALARLLGLPNGKTEAWYVLGAVPEAKVALGLNRRLTAQQLREAINAGSIPDLVRWRSVSVGDTIVVPAGTIHAIGAGIVIAEIQQRSDATFRLFDYGRNRELHIEQAISAAIGGPADSKVSPNSLADSRILLASNEHFVFEKIALERNSAWRLDAERETWFLVIEGRAQVGSFDIGAGDTIFMQADSVSIQPGLAGMTALVAYTGSGSIPHFLRRVTEPDAMNAGRLQSVKFPILTQTTGS